MPLALNVCRVFPICQNREALLPVDPPRSTAPMASCRTHFLGQPGPITSRFDRPRLSELLGLNSQSARAPHPWVLLLAKSPSPPSFRTVVQRSRCRAQRPRGRRFPSSPTEIPVIERADIKSMNALVLCTSPAVMAGFRGPRIPRRTATLIDHHLPLTWPGVPRLHAVTPIAPWTEYRVAFTGLSYSRTPTACAARCWPPHITADSPTPLLTPHSPTCRYASYPRQVPLDRFEHAATHP